MVHPDSRAKAHHILLPTEALALALIPQISSLEDFENAAREHSICPSAKIGGSLGLTKPDVLVPILEEAIFNEPLDSLIGPIETPHGHHLLWIKKRHIAEDSPE